MISPVLRHAVVTGDDGTSFKVYVITGSDETVNSTFT